jgi:RNA polymerase sigma-70 factor, ECF subfamily
MGYASEVIEGGIAYICGVGHRERSNRNRTSRRFDSAHRVVCRSSPCPLFPRIGNQLWPSGQVAVRTETDVMEKESLRMFFLYSASVTFCDSTSRKRIGKMLTAEPTNSPGTFGIEYIDCLYRYAVALTGNRVEAQDLVQETYVRAMEAFDRLRADSNVKAWMVTILRNLWFNELRKRRNRPRLVEVDADSHLAEGLVGEGYDAHQILESEQDVKRVRAAIEQLPPDFREILVLREFEELSYQEIATVLNCPAGTVMSRLGRARAKLRTLLTEGFNKRQQFGKVEPA